MQFGIRLFLSMLVGLGLLFGVPTSALAALEITNVQITPGNFALAVNWETTESSVGKVTLLDQNVTSYRPSKQDDKQGTKHSLSFTNLVDTIFVVQIDATSATGEKTTYKSEPVKVEGNGSSVPPGEKNIDFALDDIAVETSATTKETQVIWRTPVKASSSARIYNSDANVDERRESHDLIIDHVLFFQNLPIDTELTIEITSLAGDGSEDTFTGTFTVDDTLGKPLALKGDLIIDDDFADSPPGFGPQDGFNDDVEFGPIQEYFSASVLTGTALAMPRAALFNWVLLLVLVFAALLEGYFFFKRRRLWGVIYDARTKKPVEMAVVRLFDQEHHKLLETRVTPQSGRFSFLAEPGHEYYLDVTKEGYHFPTRIVTGKIDNEYTNIYRGEVIKLKAGQSLVAPDVPIDSEGGEVKALSAWRKIIIPLLDAIRLPLLILLVLALLFTDMIIELEQGPDAILMLVAAGVLVVIEILFTRRGRR